jgi:hypothetical protein
LAAYDIYTAERFCINVALPAFGQENGATMTLMLDRVKLDEELRELVVQKLNRIAGEDALLLNQQEAGEVLGHSSGWIRDRMRDGSLPYVRLGPLNKVSRLVIIEAALKGL